MDALRNMKLPFSSKPLPAKVVISSVYMCRVTFPRAMLTCTRYILDYVIIV